MFNFLKYSQALRDLKQGKRGAAARLAETGKPAATDALIEALWDERKFRFNHSETVADEAGKVLRGLGRSVLEPLLTRFKIAPVPVKCRMLRILSEIPDQRAAAFLATVLSAETDWDVVKAAGFSLARLDDPALVALLIQSRERYSQLKIGLDVWVQTLAQVKHPNVCEPLGAFLQECSWRLKHKTVHALARPGERRAVAPLALAFARADQWAAEEFRDRIPPKPEADELKHQILKVLAVIGVPEGVEVAISALRNKDLGFTPHAAIEILEKAGSPTAITALKEALLHSRDSIGTMAAKALKSLGPTATNDLETRILLAVVSGQAADVDDALSLGEQAIEPLISLFQTWERTKGTEPQLIQVARLLGQLRAASAVPVLGRALCRYNPQIPESLLHFDEGLCVAAADALGMIGGTAAREALSRCQFPYSGGGQLTVGRVLFQMGDRSGFDHLIQVATFGSPAQPEAIASLEEILRTHPERLFVEDIARAAKIPPCPDTYNRNGEIVYRMADPRPVWQAAREALRNRGE